MSDGTDDGDGGAGRARGELAGGLRGEAGPVGDLAPFCWWAGAVMLRELAPQVGRADLPWLTAGYLAGVQAWTAGWREWVEERSELG